MYAQGDLLIVPVEDIPKAAKDVTPDGRVVLAYGEVTGHAHAFYDGGVKLLERPGVSIEQVERWIDVAADKALLKHEEHAPITLPKGKYRVIRQREYDPQRDRMVAD